jgi:hypothetical protein
MNLHKDFIRRFINWLTTFSLLVVMGNFVLNAEAFEAESQIATEGVAAKSATHEKDETLPEDQSLSDNISSSTRAFKDSSYGESSRAILMVNDNQKKRAKLKESRPKANTSIMEEGMVDVEGEELIVDNTSENIELPQYSGPGPNMLGDSSPLMVTFGEGSAKEAISTSFDFLTSSDNLQQQGINDVTPQIFVEWFLATLKDCPSHPYQVPNLSLEKCFQASNVLLVR